MVVERQPESPAPSVSRRVRGSMLSSAASLLSSLGSYALISRCVGPAEYGRAAVILSLWGLCTTATDWCGGVMMRYGPVELARQRSLRLTLSTRLLFAVPALALLVPGAPLYFVHQRGGSARLGWLMAAFLVASAALGIAQWCAIAAQRFAPLTLANTLVRAMPMLVIALLWSAHRPVVAEALVVATVAGAALGATVLFSALWPLLGIVRPDRALLASMWRYSLPSLVAAPSLAAMTYVDPLILQRSVSHADVGRYQLAYLTVTAFGMAGASLNSVLSPELVGARERGDERAVERYRSVTQPRLAVSLGLCACAVACVMAPLVRALLPSAWAGAAGPAAILTVAGALMLGVWSFHPLVTVSDSVWALELATILSAITNVGLDLWLAPRAGVTGVALANVAAWGVQLVALALLLHRRIGARRLTLLLVPCAVIVLVIVAAGPGWARLVAAVALLGAGAAFHRAQARAALTTAPASAR